MLLDEELEPEEIFQMCTIMPKHKIKVIAHLEDPEGNVITVKEISKSLVEYVDSQMLSQEITPVNSQLFPTCGQFMTSIVPRFIGIELAGFMFQAPSFREALLFLSLSSVLLTRYIDQHNLKIVTTQENLSDEQIQEFIDRSEKAEATLRSALNKAFMSEEE